MTSKLIRMTASVTIVFALLGGAARADEPAAPPTPEAVMKALAESGQPGPEHKKLQPLVGDWDFTLRMWTDPAQPPVEVKGTIERRWIMGARFVQESVRSAYDGKSFEGLGLWGYDNGQKKFTNVRVCGLSGTTFSGVSECDASGKRFVWSTECRCPLSGETVTGRDEVIIESPDRIVLNVYKTVEGKEVKAMEIVSTRRK